MPEDESTSERAAEDLFERFLAGDGEQREMSFEQLCDEHPRHAPALRELLGAWRAFRGAVPGSGDGVESPPEGPVSRRLERRFGSRAVPRMSLGGEPDPPGPDDVAGRLLGQLGAHEGAERYRILGEVARGGMGRILRVWEHDLRRFLAMKVVLDTEGGSAESAGRLARFLEEAQVTGQLDHPGIVPVHELGLDSSGTVYFTMRLVRGQSLREVFGLLRAGHEQWSRTRVLGVLLKACEALAYAHSRGVVHRDLKPANIMVGRFGEVYVMDWGLARVLGQRDRKDIRIQHAASTIVRSSRRDAAQETPESPLVTMDGDVVGTPAFMAPEQARGEIERVDRRADVYAVGAILYELLSGRMPYAQGSTHPPARAVLGAVLQGPPQPVGELARSAPDELVAICERAMAREREQRYADTEELAEDLRAYLENRVVRAHRTGPAVELAKWVRRNRVLAAALLLLLLGAGGLSVVGAGFAAARRERAAARSHAYVAGLAWTQSAIETESVVEARLRLERAPREHRGWEWRHLGSQVESSLQVVEVPRPGIESIAPAADGKRFATPGRGGTVEIWDAETVERVRQLTGHPENVRVVACSPDGTRLASGCAAGSVLLRDVDSGSIVARFDDHESDVRSLAFSSDGSLLASGDESGRMRIYSLPAAELLRELVESKAFEILDLDFGPDGRRLASAASRGDDGFVRVWDVATGRALVSLPSSVFAVRFSRDGERLFWSLNRNPHIAVSDSRTGAVLGELRGHRSASLCLALDPSGERLVSGSRDGSVRVWSADTLAPLAVLRGHELQVRSAAFVGARLFSGTTNAEGGTLRAWDSSTALNPTQLVHPGPVRGLAFGPAGERLVTGAIDGIVRLWDVDARQLLAALEGHAGSVPVVAFHPAGTMVASAGVDHTVRLWSAVTGEPLHVLEGHDNEVWGVDFHPDGALVASGSEDHTVRLWDTQTGACIRVLRGHTKRVYPVAFSPDGRLLASGAWDHTARIWDVQEGTEVLALEGHEKLVFGVAFSPDGGRLATASFDGTVKSWDVRTGRELRAFPHSRFGVTKVAFHPDGTRIATVAHEPLVRIWDTESGEELLALRDNEDESNAVSFSPDGTRLATASTDGNVRIWDSMPWRDRRRVIESRRQAREGVAALVDELFALGLAPREVAKRLDDDATLDAAARRAAADLVLRAASGSAAAGR